MSKLDKLQALLASSVESDADTSLLADLLSISTDASPPIPNLSPQRRKERTFEALIRRLETLATERPVLMLVEDAHWADPSSTELFDLTIDRLMGSSILLVMTFRPEFHAPWIGRAGVSLVALSRLDRRNVASMAIKVASQAMSSELIERIVTQTDGVPLFIEELTRALVEAGLPASGAATRLAVPDTLQASLLARLDRLPAAKAVAQIGAVIGRTFSYELIAAVSGLPEPALQEGLEQLVELGLAFERGALPEASYHVQALAGAGCRIREFVARPPGRVARTDCRSAAGPKSRCGRDPGRPTRVSLRGSRLDRTGDRALAKGGAIGPRSLGKSRGDNAAAEGGASARTIRR